MTSENSVHLDEHTLYVQTLFVQHQQALLAYVLSLEPDLHDAQEIVQETFMAASRKASTWTDGTNFLAWACVIARLNTLHFQRTRSGRNARLAADVVELLAQESELDFATFQSQVTALKRCLRALAPKARELINLRYHAGKLPEQIAHVAATNGKENGLYFNGEPVGTAHAPQFSSQRSNDFFADHQAVDCSTKPTAIDELRCYDRALAAVEIKAIYDNEKP